MPDLPALAAPSSVTFGDLLRHHRTAAGLTQEELAERAQLSSDAISTLERGARRRPRKDTVALLADALALPDEERAAFAAAARHARAAALTATPPGNAATADLDGQARATAPDVTLPHGIVTFLIAEVENATHLLHELADRYADVLSEVQVLLRAVWATHAGHELGTQGDRFFAVFAYAEDALAAAAAVQQALAARSWPEGARVQVRLGLHSGAAFLTAGRYVGLEVHRAACIAAAGHGGQVVVSGAVAEQVAKFGYELPAGTSLRDLGKHRLQDLPHREELHQLVLPDLPGLPTAFPPLRTLDAWPGLRADLTAVALGSVVMLAVVGLLLVLLAPAFPWAIGLGAAGLALLVLLGAVLAEPVRHALETQWRDARKPVAAVTSALLSLVVVVTTLFITKPPIVIGPTHLGYDFSYTYHAPIHRGGTVTVGLYGPLGPLDALDWGEPLGLANGCVTHLPNMTLGLTGWKPDQCTEVPTVANGDESPDGKTTTFHIDRRAVWSDGAPLTAEDYLFAYHVATDPNLFGGGFPLNQIRQITALDARTVRIDWTVDFAEYLEILQHSLLPLPLHAYATGPFASVYLPATNTYNSALAQQLLASAGFQAAMPVDNGPFTVQSFVPNTRAVLVRNPRFFSNYFHRPALDQVTFVNVDPQWPHGISEAQGAEKLVTQYRQGAVDVVELLSPLDLSLMGGIPKAQVITSPLIQFLDIGFNQRPEAPNAQANGGVSIFRDPNVRKAFVEAFDRCAAVRAQLGITVNCSDPNLFTDEPTTAGAPDYDPSVRLPPYNPADAARLLDRAGYPVVDGIRRAKDGKTPLQLTIQTSGAGARAALIARRMQQDYSHSLNITVTLLLTGNLFSDNISGKGTFDIGLWGEQGATALVWNAQLILGSTDSADIPNATNPGGTNFLGVVDSWVVNEEQLGVETLDYDQRVNVFRQVKAHIAQQFYLEPVFITADVALVKPTLCNFKKWPFPFFNTWNIADWYVAHSCPS